MRIQKLTPEQISKTWLQRLNHVREVRKSKEAQWLEAEKTCFNTGGSSSGSFSSNVSLSFETEAELGVTGVDNSSLDVGINRVFKNVRLIHSQLSANPPSVVARPTSSDTEDRKKADAADRLIRYAIRQYKLQERFDLATLSTLIRGIGILKVYWNADEGEIIDFDKDTDEFTMSGDISVEVINPWNLYLDVDANSDDKVRYAIERMIIPIEEAQWRFPDKQEQIKRSLEQSQSDGASFDKSFLGNQKRQDVIEVYQCWETGLPYNGYQGKFFYMLGDGTLLTEVRPNPHRFSPQRNSANDDKLPPRAQLPYIWMTDLDVPEDIMGKAVVDFESGIQDIYNRMINVSLDNLQAHGVARLVIPDGTEIADDSITNSAYDVIKYTGQREPSFMQPMPFPPEFVRMMGVLEKGIDDMAGVNESMFGQQSREQSGFSMQYATNQGNMIRRRLFNKYTLFVESFFRTFLNLVKKHWTEKRIIKVLGEEKAFESIELKGSDIDGGYDITAEYGASLSLDPVSRREEMLSLLPLFEKAGVDAKALLGLLKLDELEGAYDMTQLGKDRQSEIFEEITATGMYVPPKELQDHKSMLDYAYTYLMTAEFKYLSPEIQGLIEKHVKEREMLAAKGAAGTMAAPAQPGPAPLPPMPGAPLPGVA